MKIGRIKENILNEIDNREKEIVRLCCDLISIPSENPPGDTTNIAQFLKDYLKEKGFKVEVYEPKKGIVNLVTTVEGSQQKPNLILNGHIDVFPAGNEKAWDLPPFYGQVKYGKLWGRGAADMKGGLAASLAAFTLIGCMEIDLPGKLTLTIVSDEESGGKWGTEWLIDNVPAALGDACFIGEPTALQVRVGEKGACWLRVKTQGKAAHGAYTPVLGDNAIMKMAKVLQVAESLRDVKGKIPNEAKELSENAKYYLEKTYPGLGRVFDHVSVNVGTIKNGVNVNIVPASCEAELDIRVPIGITPEEVKKELQVRLREAGLEDVEYEFINKNEANYTSPNEKVVKVVCENATEVTGSRSRPSATVGATDGRFFRRKSIPTVVFGPTEHNMGAPNEYITVEDLIKVAKVHSGVVIDYYNLSPTRT